MAFKHVMTVDTGPTLGMASRRPDGQIRSWQIPTDLLDEPHYRVASWLDKEHAACKIEHMCIEPFAFNKEHKDRGYIDFSPAEWVGVFKLWCEWNGVYYTLQQPSTVVGKTAFWGDASPGNTKLRTLGLWVPDRTSPKKNNAHQRDALRHLLYCLTNMEDDKAFYTLLRTKTKYHDVKLDMHIEL